MDLIPGALRGMGHSAVPMVLSVIGTVGTRIVWIYGLFPHHRSLFFLFISYPGYGKVYSSMRLEAMRDGIADYELLRLLEEKDPAAAAEIVDAVVMDFDSYNSDIENFRKVRTRLLTELEKY